MPMPRVPYIILAIVVLAAGGAYLFFERIPAPPPPPGEAPPAAVLPGTPISDSENRQAAATLRDVRGGEATAEANWTFEQGAFTLGLRAEELAVLSGDQKKFYAGWLLTDLAAATVAVYLGPLTRVPSGAFAGDYVLGYATPADLRAYRGIVVTQESLDDQKPETRILEGSFP